MPEAEKKIACPKCAREFEVALEEDMTHLTCPSCQAEIPEESFRVLAKAPDELAPGIKAGQRLGNYVVESLLGSGGMAVVLRGRQLSLNRNVAIKILPGDLAKKKFFVARFESEAAVLANLNHPNIVSVIDRGRHEDTYFIVMEYVEGETLKARMRRRGLFSPAEVIPIVLQVLAGLEYAHRRGVVHRDIKPGNIMINREEMVKIADFGLAHLAKEQGGLDVTRVGHAMGTLTYMAPEQLTNAKQIDSRADLYSLGVCVYEMLTGKLPLGTFKLPSECDRTADLRWDDVILRTLKMEPEERFSSAQEMAEALRAIAATPGKTLAQEEREEESEISSKAGVNLLGCGNCGHESKRSARRCEVCNASLSDLFEECPSCKMENRVDVPRCPGCGGDLAAYQAQMRREAQAIQEKAKQLVSERDFDQALDQLKKLTQFRTREYATIRESARVWIERIGRRQERFYQGTYEAGQRLIAEGLSEQALEVWAVLPDTYRDVAEHRKEIAAKAPLADAAAAEGQRLYDGGDLAGAISSWEKAAAFRPHEPELRKRLSVARARLGNLNLKRTYMKESEEAAARGDYVEALALCRRVLDLDPADKTARAVRKELEAKRRESARQEVESAPKVRLPGMRRKGFFSKWLTPRAIGFAGAAAGVVALVVWIAFVYIPQAHQEAEEAAARLLQDAKDLKDKGDTSGALADCRRIETKFSGTTAAEGASDLEKELTTLEADAQTQFGEAEKLASGKDLPSWIASFNKLQELLKGPSAVASVDLYRVQAKTRLEELREEIALGEARIAAECEKKGEWQKALDLYRSAAEEYGFAREPITSKLKEAGKRLDDCAALVKTGRLAAQSGQAEEAFRSATAALDLVSADPAANQLLADAAPKLIPPGMALVPAGRYVVGGSEGNPERTVDLPRGFYIETTAVTCERFAEFLRATKRAAPPGWGAGGAPPAGAAKLPVANVTWEEAAAYAAWAGRTLPTEEQWECACRGASGQPYPWGKTWEPTAAVLGFGPAPAGGAPRDRSPSGCMDMAGNVAEWTATKVAAASVPAAGGTPSYGGSGGNAPRRYSPSYAQPGAGEKAETAPAPSVGGKVTSRDDDDEMPRRFRLRRAAAAGGAATAASTAAGPSPAVANPVSLALYAVKGSSWAGLEKGRPTTVVVYPQGEGTNDSPLMLSPAPQSPEWLVRSPSNIEIQYVGLAGEGVQIYDYVLVRRWMPEWGQWAESKFRAAPGQAIGEPGSLVVEEGEAGRTRRKAIEVDFSTGCTVETVTHEPKMSLTYRDPAGALREAPYVVVGALRPPRMGESKKAPLSPQMSLQEVVRAAARMAGQANVRYMNVGFRCIRMLWTPPPAGPAGQAPGGKQAGPG